MALVSALATPTGDLEETSFFTSSSSSSGSSSSDIPDSASSSSSTNTTPPASPTSLIPVHPLLASFENGPDPIFHPQTLHAAFTLTALQHSALPALTHASTTISYSTLHTLSSSLARHLSAKVLPRTRVVLLAQRGIPLVVSILAILKCGAQYVPLDGGVCTDSTLAHVIKDSGCSVVVCGSRFVKRINNAEIKVVDLEATLEALSTEGETGNLEEVDDDSVRAEDGAYVIYTSGTTGTPKGVDVSHGNVTNLLCQSPGNLGLKPGKKVAQVLNVAFDMATWEIFASLLNGATLVLRTSAWAPTLSMVDTLVATPTIVAHHNIVSAYPNITTVATAGEPCPVTLADALVANGKAFYNCCGPTETTIVNTMHLHEVGRTLTIGKPTPGNRVVILNETEGKWKRASIGEVGTMWAGGRGVSRCYVNLPELTRSRWVNNICGDGETLFNTGDLGRWLPSGELDIVGRVDDQVKVKGFRVELDGVAAAMEMCPSVTKAKALLIDGKLWGFAEGVVSVEDLKATVAGVQPYYAVPSQWRVLKAFPMTANGKVDRVRLRELASEDEGRQETSPVLVEKNMGSTVKTAELASDIPVYPQTALVLAEKPAFTSHLTSINSSSSSSQEDLEKQESWTLPPVRHPLLHRIRNRVFTLYRRLFTIIFLANLGILISYIARPSSRSSIPRFALASTGNLAAAVLIRNDHVINAIYTLLCSVVPRSAPLWIRRTCAKAYHLGGIHSGCAVFAVLWLGAVTGAVTQSYINSEDGISTATLAMTWALQSFLIAQCGFAYPPFRVKYHDYFERIHRFAGWTALALVWIQTILITRDSLPAGRTLSSGLVHSTVIWLLVAITCAIMYPWLHLRRVPVTAVVLSPHAVRLYFEYCRPPVAGSFVRISTQPLIEWHSFATIPSLPSDSPSPATKARGYSLIVSKAGDWTAAAIATPPEKLWVRGVPACGVMRICTLFRSVVVVATGSGIGPCLAVLRSRSTCHPSKIRVLWTTPDSRATFGDNVVDDVLGADPQAVIWNTRKQGKPDMVKLAYGMYKECGAEAVCVISNQRLTRLVVGGLESRGVAAAYGAVWDS